MKIHSIYMKNLHKVDEASYVFDGQTYLYGPNGVGKTTVLNAIQLALLGYIPGMSKKHADIFRHAKESPMIVQIKLIGEDGPVTIRRRWYGKSTISCSVEITPEDYNIDSIIEDIELPIFNFGEFSKMTSNQLKSWFIQFLPDVESEINWTEILKYDDTIRDETLIPSIMEEVKSCNLTGVELVKHINAFMKSKLSFVQSELTRQSSTIQSLVYYDEEDLEDEDPDSIKEKIQSLTKTRNDIASQSRLVEQKKSLLKQVADIESEYQLVDCVENDERIKQIDQNQETLTQTLAETDEKITQLGTEYMNLEHDCYDMQSVVDGSGICPFTSSVCPSIQKMVEEYRVKLPELLRKKNEVRDQQESLSKWRKSAADAGDVKIQEKLRICGAYGSRGRLLDMLEKLSDVPEEILSTDEIDAEIQRLQDTLVKVQANEKYNKLIDKLTASKYALEQDVLVLKKWIKDTDANGLQSRLMTEPFKNLAEDLNSYIADMMPDDISKVNFYIAEKANSFSFGVTRTVSGHESYIPYDLLSSGEKCMYAIGLMMYIVEHSSSPLKVILVDDLLDHVDDGQLSKLWTWLSATDTQMIFAGVHKCDAAGCEDSNWRCIDVSAEDKNAR